MGSWDLEWIQFGARYGGTLADLERSSPRWRGRYPTLAAAVEEPGTYPNLTLVACFHVDLDGSAFSAFDSERSESRSSRHDDGAPERARKEAPMGAIDKKNASMVLSEHLMDPRLNPGAVNETGDLEEWWELHAAAVSGYFPGTPGAAVLHMAAAGAAYADAYAKEFGNPVGEDGVLGPPVLAAFQATNALLNGPLDTGTGRLDAGTVHRALRAAAAGAGFDADDV